MNSISVRRLLLIAVLLSCQSCASSGGVQGLGTRLLNFIGYRPDQTAIKPSSTIATEPEKATPEEEYHLGRAVAAHILTRYKLYDDAQLTNYVNSVGRTVAASSSMPDTFGGYHFAVLDSDELNAMSAPGGTIFITRGLLLRMPSEDALASVLAHEIAHVEKRHGIRSISKDKISSALAAAGQVAASLSCNEVLAQGVLVFSTVADDIAEKLLTKGYSREFEYEADAVSIQTMERAGYKTDSILIMLHVVEVAGAASTGGWFSTHPAPAERQEKVQTVIAGFSDDFALAGLQQRTDRFQKTVAVR